MRAGQNVIGKFRLVEMEQWDQEFVDLVEPGFIALTAQRWKETPDRRPKRLGKT